MCTHWGGGGGGLQCLLCVHALGGLGHRLVPVAVSVPGSRALKGPFTPLAAGVAPDEPALPSCPAAACRVGGPSGVLTPPWDKGLCRGRDGGELHPADAPELGPWGRGESLSGFPHGPCFSNRSGNAAFSRVQIPPSPEIKDPWRGHHLCCGRRRRPLICWAHEGSLISRGTRDGICAFISGGGQGGPRTKPRWGGQWIRLSHNPQGALLGLSPPLGLFRCCCKNQAMNPGSRVRLQLRRPQSASLTPTPFLGVSSRYRLLPSPLPVLKLPCGAAVTKSRRTPPQRWLHFSIAGPVPDSREERWDPVWDQATVLVIQRWA